MKGRVIVALAILGAASCGDPEAADAGPQDGGDRCEGADPPCCPAGPTWELLEWRLAPEPSDAPTVAPLGAVELPGGGFGVLVFQASVDFEGVHRLLLFASDGAPGPQVELGRVERRTSGTADLASVGDAIWVAGIDRSDPVELWLARVNPAGELLERRTLRSESPAPFAEGGLALLADGLEADLYLAEGGSLTRSRVTETTFEAGVEAWPASLPPVTRVSGARRDGTTCLVLRDVDGGRLFSARPRSGETLAPILLSDEAAGFNAPVVVADGECVVAYYAPDLREPLRGAVRLTSTAGRITGWLGTAPGGLAVIEDGSAVLMSTFDPVLGDTTSVWSVSPAGDDCQAAVPLARFDVPAVLGTSLGSMLSVSTPEADFAILANHTGWGELAIARLIGP